MTAGTLPVEIFNRIVQHLRIFDLPPLCRLNRAFQRVAERKLYSNLILADLNLAYRICISIVANEGFRGQYVKRFHFVLDSRRGVVRGQIPNQFWQAVQLALSTMTELKDLTIHDPLGTTTWILDPEALKFQLHTARLHLHWDEYMVAFLQTQNQLRSLLTYDAADVNEVCSLPMGYLPALQILDAPLLVAFEVLTCPDLAILRTHVDDDVFHLLPQLVENASLYGTPLQCLHVNLVPEAVLPDVLAALTTNPKMCSRMMHLGILFLPCLDVSFVSAVIRNLVSPSAEEHSSSSSRQIVSLANCCLRSFAYGASCGRLSAARTSYGNAYVLPVTSSGGVLLLGPQSSSGQCVGVPPRNMDTEWDATAAAA